MRKKTNAEDVPVQIAETKNHSEILRNSLSSPSPTVNFHAHPAKNMSMNKSSAVFFTIFSAIGIIASTELILAEIQIIKDPDAALSCDINPLIGCGSLLHLPVSHLLFGIPNALVGVMAYAALVMAGAAFMSKISFPRWMAVGFIVSTLGAVAFIFFFQWYSFFVKNTLCPWCFVTWMITIPIVVLIWGSGLQSIKSTKANRAGEFIWANRWTLTVSWWLLLLITMLLVWWQQWIVIIRGLISF